MLFLGTTELSLEMQGRDQGILCEAYSTALMLKRYKRVSEDESAGYGQSTALRRQVMSAAEGDAEERMMRQFIGFTSEQEEGMKKCQEGRERDACWEERTTVYYSTEK